MVSASFPTGTCQLVPNSQILRITNCFLTGAMTIWTTQIVLNGIRNPPSFKVSESFKIQTYSSVPTLTNFITSGITVQMNTASTLSTFTITPLDSTVHANTKHAIRIIHVIPLLINEYVVLNFDSTMQISNTVSCTALSGLSAISCIRNSNSQLKIIYTALPSSQTL